MPLRGVSIYFTRVDGSAPKSHLVTFMPNPAAVSDTTGEWIELYAAANVDLNGLTISSGTSKTKLASNACLAVTAGTYVILAKTEDPAGNGNLTDWARRSPRWRLYSSVPRSSA